MTPPLYTTPQSLSHMVYTACMCCILPTSIEDKFYQNALDNYPMTTRKTPGHLSRLIDQPAAMARQDTLGDT